MDLAEFNYDLPAEIIAQRPLAERDSSRLLVVDRGAGRWRDSAFAELPTLVAPGDVLVLNNTRVFPARLVGRRVRGGRVEVLLVRSRGAGEWEVIGKPGRALRPGAELEFGGGRLRGVVTRELEEGRRQIRFEGEGPFEEAVDAIGRTPLPPYIRRPGGDDSADALRPDRERYQTVYARERGAIAAPTAGLHFTPRVLGELRARGAALAEVTHHVGYATFQPVRAARVEEHRLESERYEVGAAAAAEINAARRRGGRVIAVGTTTARALESAADAAGEVRAGRGETDLVIIPGYRFRALDGLLTNFHLPQSSLLLLVAAFAGRELALAAYRHAVAERYRFYSYGDCMLIT
jgi:S-adenosylmethionine:tRNA ribosyltransferase-isomerase